MERGYKVICRDALQLIEDITEARELGTIRKYREQLKKTDLLLIDDLFLRRLPAGAGDELADVSDEPLREGLDDHHLKPRGRGLAETARGRRRRGPAARPSDAPRSPAQVRGKELAAQGGRRAACQQESSELGCTRPVANRVEDFDPAIGGGV